MQVWDLEGKPVEAPAAVVQNDLNRAPLLDSVPAIYFLGVMIPTADGSQMRIAKLSGDVFLQNTIFQVGEARKSLVEYFQKLNDDQQTMINWLNDSLVFKPVATNLAVTYTATAAILTATSKTVTANVPGIVKDETLMVSVQSVPNAWGYQKAIAIAANTIEFTLLVPPLSLNGSGTCTFNVLAQRKLVP